MLKTVRSISTLFIVLILTPTLFADPCGMVPPIASDGTAPIARIGEQRTYVFFKDGVETFVIRPGFSGNVDEFGMLIPFPTPPSLRKVPDSIFEHIAAAIDPPEVVIHQLHRMRMAMAAPASNVKAEGLNFRREVRVLREEAVGMYEIAVLEAGSAEALKRWMDEHGYRYPDGMDTVCNDYVDDGWCFVAVKTKVGQKEGVDPKPGQRDVVSKLPDGSTFDGNVQAMGFRFKTDELVVPMRLSAFNDGDLRNIVYLLTDGPRRIRKIPEEYVVRQIPGETLIKNVTDLLPIRFVGFRPVNAPPRKPGAAPPNVLVQPNVPPQVLPSTQLPSISNYKPQRDPHPKNGAAKELFAADLLAVSSGQLSLPQEEREKELLEIGERLGLRGPKIDNVNAKALHDANEKTVQRALKDLAGMTLTVVDGDFPREVIAGDNLTFANYKMPRQNNTKSKYDANTKQPWNSPGGTLILGANTPPQSGHNQFAWNVQKRNYSLALIPFAFFWLARGRRSRALLAILLVTLILQPTNPTIAFEPQPEAMRDAFKKRDEADGEVKRIVERAKSHPAKRSEIVRSLIDLARNADEISQRGWAIVALGEIGGYDVDEQLLSIHADENQSELVRTWAAAARVAMTTTSAGLVEKSQLIFAFPALGRPIGMRLVEKLSGDGSVSVEKLIKTSLDVPQIQQSVTPAIIAKGTDALVGAMTSSTDQSVRRQSAAYLGTLAQQNASVPAAVIAAYRFDKSADDVPWKDGPLFVPGLQWEKTDARALVGNLVAWHLWCDRNGRAQEQRQIHNNLRSLALAKAAGYESPGFSEANTVTWLKVWGKTVGKDVLRALLSDQDAVNTPKYGSVLSEI